MRDDITRRHLLQQGSRLFGAGFLSAEHFRVGPATEPSEPMETAFHLTARPWKPLNTPREAYLDAIEGVCRFTIRHQNAQGAVIDPFLGREHQYSTPYFAFAVGALMEAGHTRDLWENGIRAMEHSTADFAKGKNGIPDGHGEFFLASLAGALPLYAAHVPAETLARWRERLRTPLTQVMQGLENNWRTYAMKGEWLRATEGLADREAARRFIGDSWLHATQRDRIAADRWNLYQDRQTDPESHAVEAVGRGNLLALIAAGYDGEWKGSFYVTKNYFDPRERVGYQDASNYGNYNGAVMLHLAEASLARRSAIVEQPTPCEIGGYAVASDPRFASVVANAGGMQMFANLRGDTKLVYKRYWTALGVVRFARTGWDSRLGPSDGIRDAATKQGVSFAPAWREEGKWVRLADMPERYAGSFSVQFSHPLLVRCAIDYAPLPGASGPRFRHAFVMTPDGIFARLSSPDAVEFGVTWPLLENDGAPLQTTLAAHHASTHYTPQQDEQSFLALHPDALLTADEPAIRSAYGWLRPVRMTTRSGGPLDTFVYPRSPGEPDAEAVRASFQVRDDGFSSLLGRVQRNLVVGRAAAGGEGESLDLTGDGKNEVRFPTICRFILQLHAGKVHAGETDRPITGAIQGRQRKFDPYTPLTF
ncbi:MAG: hypothetical protein JWL77_5609 [Chthonomonadaceae bacterium]|nr:hypothetical protein [Chthonomonadaceae bacterium]